MPYKIMDKLLNFIKKPAYNTDNKGKLTCHACLADASQTGFLLFLPACSSQSGLLHLLQLCNR